MAVDMKEVIAQAARTLLFEKKVKRITVKDIVEECNLTRQTFYYHFADIPDLLEWIIKQNGNKLLVECRKHDNIEEQVQFLLTLVTHTRHILKRGMESNYSEELAQLIFKNTQEIFLQIATQNGTLEHCDPYERDFMIRYHTAAILGMLRQWSDTDTEHIEQVAHIIARMLTNAGIEPSAS